MSSSSCSSGGTWCGSSSCLSLSSCGSWWETPVLLRLRPSPPSPRVNAARPRHPATDPKALAKGSSLLTALHRALSQISSSSPSEPLCCFRLDVRSCISHCALPHILSSWSHSFTVGLKAGAESHVHVPTNTLLPSTPDV